jgi:hypothetical protein
MIWQYSNKVKGISEAETRRFQQSLRLYTIEELKWDILILRWSGIGNDLK